MHTRHLVARYIQKYENRRMFVVLYWLWARLLLRTWGYVDRNKARGSVWLKRSKKSNRVEFKNELSSVESLLISGNRWHAERFMFLYYLRDIVYLHTKVNLERSHKPKVRTNDSVYNFCTAVSFAALCAAGAVLPRVRAADLKGVLTR